MTKLSVLEANRVLENLALNANIRLTEDTRTKIISFSLLDRDLLNILFNNFINDGKMDFPIEQVLDLSKSESKIITLLFKKIGMFISRDEIGQILWGVNWYEKYSDWSIDTHIHNLRKKLGDNWKIITKRESGYLLSKNRNIHINIKNEFVNIKSTDISPIYIEYMNNPSNVRKTYFDLFTTLKKDQIKLEDFKNILAINSFTIDNVNYLCNWKNVTPESKIIFTNFNDVLIEMINKRIEKLMLTNIFSIYDDINNTRLKENIFDLIINDFRLNFNNSHNENVKSMKNMYKVLTRTGKVLLSVVVDPRYESRKYGHNQEKAPINKNSPCIFEANENLPRKCFTVRYYKQLIKRAGFKIIKEFDIIEGKKWINRLDLSKIYLPTYRRFLLEKLIV